MSEPKQVISSMTDEALREFVQDWIGGRIFSSCHLGRDGADHMLGRVFMPVAFGAVGPQMIEVKDLPDEIPDDMEVEEWDYLQNGGHEKVQETAEILNEKRHKEYGEQLGIIWEYLSEALPRSINGYPIFMSCRVMNKADWERVVTVLKAEEERLANIEV